MTALASVETDIGTITLHAFAGGRFETRRRYVGTDGRPYRADIPVTEAGAREWYALAKRRGQVRRPFPETSSPRAAAATERD